MDTTGGGGEGGGLARGAGGGAVPWFVYLFMRLDVAERAEPPSAKRRSRDLDVYPHFVFHPDRQRSEVKGQRSLAEFTVCKKGLVY